MEFQIGKIPAFEKLDLREKTKYKNFSKDIRYSWCYSFYGFKAVGESVKTHCCIMKKYQ
jgi:hypothetical protein